LLVSIIFIGLEKKLISYIKIKNSIQKILSYLENKDIIIKLTNNLIYNFNKEIIFSLKNFKNDKILSIYTIKKNIYYKIIKKNSLFIDYHKNNIIYYLIMETFIASSIIYSNKNKLFSINSKNLIKIIKKIIYILKYEFIYEFNFSIENKILDILYKESIYKKNIFLNKKCIKNIRFLNNQIKNLLELYLISTLNIKTLIKSPPKKKILINNLFKYIKIYNKKNKNLKKILPNKYLLINSINFLTNTQLIKISKSKSIILSPNFEFKSKKIINFLTKILIKTHKF
jgi:glycerol-3-phosphate O-acyltransferase